ncbi:preprotein translocase subunit SecE [Mycoplasmopsis columboralis]|uniref:Protein translocase subunit SecE n=1 Tax=Mycoplasmopsis columboralis TaxID=171282 RepID=A0A449B5L1_9BACT|nr:preprotein translocase subunit SecE [Mycoplasmopsis columboralis]VEU75894.1 Uncharacterised protein [Mycoplasmopsis columboralis]
MNHLNEQNTSKAKKPKRYWIRKFIKEIKRVKWPNSKTNVAAFIKILVFTLIITAFVFAVSFAFTHIWTSSGLS